MSPEIRALFYCVVGMAVLLFDTFLSTTNNSILQKSCAESPKHHSTSATTSSSTCALLGFSSQKK